MGAQYYDTQGSTSKLIGIIDGHLRHDGFDPDKAHRFKIIRTLDGAYLIELEPQALATPEPDSKEGE